MMHVRQCMEEETHEPQTAILILEGKPKEDSEEGVIEGEIVENPSKPKTPFLQRRVSPKWLIVFAITALLATSLIMIYLLPLFFVSATVTIVPTEKRLSLILDMQLPYARSFPSQTRSETITVAATGKGHQNATQARGTVTLYNAAPYGQTIDAGTLLIGSDNVHIVTDEAAYIPGANAPLEGQATVPAHAINAGNQGNIAAYDINGQCCRDNIFVKNLTAFTGGMEARDYRIVTKNDVDTAALILKTNGAQRIRTSFLGKLQPGEALTPPLCSLKTVTNHKVGQEAQDVAVTGLFTCIASAYSIKAFQKQVSYALLTASVPLVGKGYVINGTLLTSTLSTIVTHGSVTVSVKCVGSLVYQFSPLEKHIIIMLIAGKERSQATNVLIHFRGIDQVIITLSRQGAILPTEMSSIRIVVLKRGI